MNTLCFELCVESLESARIGEAGGADRIELCSELWMGGVTPAPDLIAAVIRALAIPVRVLIRPRGGDFCYSAVELDLMRRQIGQAMQAGAAGIAVGVLLPDGRVDVARSRELVELARPMGATFHRAFDETRQMDDALEDVIETGADCLLTSGGAADVVTGAEVIARLHQRAGKRLNVIPGGGLRLDNLTDLVRRTGVTFLHGSLIRKDARSGSGSPGNKDGAASKSVVLEDDVREAIRLFHQAHRADGTASTAC
jgi:copper homeostasis protein